MKVGVTGVGGGVGQSIMKALTVSTLSVEVFAIDIQLFSAGLFRANERMILPKLDAPGAQGEWERVLRDRCVDALIPGSDHDLLILAQLRDEWLDKGVCHVLVSDLEVVRTCRDKAATCKLLASYGIPVPRSAWDLDQKSALAWARSNGYPVVIKPRDGSASRHFHVVRDKEELGFYFKRTPNPILQEYLSKSGEVQEFTCSVFVDRAGEPVGTFMARRELVAGATYRAEINHWPEIDELLLAIGSALRPRGMINVQLRMTERGPIPFELNARCSGTTAIRAYFGFNEPEMLVRHYVLEEELVPPQPRAGYAMRYWNEVFLDGDVDGILRNSLSGVRGDVPAWL